MARIGIELGIPETDERVLRFRDATEGELNRKYLELFNKHSVLPKLELLISKEGIFQLQDIFNVQKLRDLASEVMNIHEWEKAASEFTAIITKNYAKHVRQIVSIPTVEVNFYFPQSLVEYLHKEDNKELEAEEFSLNNRLPAELKELFKIKVNVLPNVDATPRRPAEDALLTDVHTLLNVKTLGAKTDIANKLHDTCARIRNLRINAFCINEDKVADLLAGKEKPNKDEMVDVQTIEIVLPPTKKGYKYPADDKLKQIVHNYIRSQNKPKWLNRLKLKFEIHDLFDEEYTADKLEDVICYNETLAKELTEKEIIEGCKMMDGIIKDAFHFAQEKLPTSKSAEIIEKANEEIKLQLTPLHEVVNTVAEILNQHDLTDEELNNFAVSLIGIITSKRNAEINRLIGLNDELITQINNGTSISSTQGKTIPNFGQSEV